MEKSLQQNSNYPVTNEGGMLWKCIYLDSNVLLIESVVIVSEAKDHSHNILVNSIKITVILSFYKLIRNYKWKT